MSNDRYTLTPIGWVESSLVEHDQAPKQGDEGAPHSWLVFNADVRAGLPDLRADTEVLVLTWFDRAQRDVLVVHPRSDPANPATGVFSTRSPHRPNPIGLHRVTILDIADLRVRVRDLEALHGTPVLDVKPVIRPASER